MGQTDSNVISNVEFTEYSQVDYKALTFCVLSSTMEKSQLNYYPLWLNGRCVPLGIETVRFLFLRTYI